MSSARDFEADASLPMALADAKPPFTRLGVSFFIFGLINNVLYVIILSAALDLVPPSTPKGIIAFCNIAPALVAKVGWPYVLRGRIRYRARLFGCCAMSVLGMAVVAAFNSLSMRLLGIGLASFSSGLGELTFLQLSTTYSPRSVSGHAVGFFASGTGAAGLVGAALWWGLRGLGVRRGVGLSTILPFVTPLAYFLLLPSIELFGGMHDIDEAEPVTAAEYTAVPMADPADQSDNVLAAGKPSVSLSLGDKWSLVRPLLVKFMLPLFCVYTLEYTINQGVSPTLVYPVPDLTSHAFLALIFKSIRDYYPAWQLVYQTFVFLSRSSISLGVPPLPTRLLALPALLQAVILALLAVESARGLFAETSALAIVFVFTLIAIEGICGGLAYVNVFYRVGQEHSPGAGDRGRQEREFKIGSIGFADSLGILCASLFAVPTELQLCAAQKRRGKMLCALL